jgi:hypothetical protein
MSEKLKTFYQFFYNHTEFYSEPMTKETMILNVMATLDSCGFDEQALFTILPVELTETQYKNKDKEFICWVQEN